MFYLHWLPLNSLSGKNKVFDNPFCGTFGGFLGKIIFFMNNGLNGFHLIYLIKKMLAPHENYYNISTENILLKNYLSHHDGTCYMLI